jgi:hypothetical protein
LGSLWKVRPSKNVNLQLRKIANLLYRAKSKIIYGKSVINQSALGFVSQFKELKLNNYFELPAAMNKVVLPKITCIPIVKSLKRAVTSHIELSTNGLSIDVDQTIVYEVLCLHSKIQQFNRNLTTVMPPSKAKSGPQTTAPSSSLEFSLKFRSDFAKCNLFTTNPVQAPVSSQIITSMSMIYPTMDVDRRQLSGQYHKCDTLVIPPVSLVLQHQSFEQSSTEISINIESSLLRVSWMTVTFLRDAILAAKSATTTTSNTASNTTTATPSKPAPTPVSTLIPVIKLCIHLDKTVLELPSNIHAEVVCRVEIGPIHFILSTFAKKYKNSTVSSYNFTTDITKMAVKVNNFMFKIS